MASLAQAEERLQHDPYDMEAWEVVLTVADKQSLAQGRDLYERFLAQFPCAAVQWKALVDAELRAGDFDAAERHLYTCLDRCPHLGLWDCSIRLTRLKTQDDLAHLAAAYELLLDRVGLDVSAMPHWRDYVAVLKTQARADPKVNAKVRAAYHRALTLPLARMDQLWKEYESWEMMHDRTLGRQLVSDLGKQYHPAKDAGAERAKLRLQAPLDQPGRPPCAGDAPLVRAWRQFLAFEINGSFRLSEDDQAARARLAFEQALLPLRLHSEVYLTAALFSARSGHVEIARAFWKRGAMAVPGCALVPLAEADFEERAGNLDRAAGAYERLVEAAPTAVAWVHAMRFARRVRGLRAARAVFAKARKACCAWQVYVAAAALEANTEPSRGDCGRGDRDDDDAGLDAGTRIAVAIFERGLEVHGSTVAYVRTYGRFLRARALHDRARSVYERALARIDADGGMSRVGAGKPSRGEVAQLWSDYIHLERSVGSVASVEVLERRCAEQRMGAADPMAPAALARRYRCVGLWPCDQAEAEVLGVAETPDGDELGFGFAESGVDAIAFENDPLIAPTPATVPSALASLSAASDREPGGGVERRRRRGGEAGAEGRDHAGQDFSSEPVDAPLSDVEAMQLAHRLGAPDQITTLMTLLPSPAEFAGKRLGAEDVNLVLENLVTLSPNLHAHVSVAVQLQGGSMVGRRRVAAETLPCAGVPAAGEITGLGPGAVEATRTGDEDMSSTTSPPRAIGGASIEAVATASVVQGKPGSGVDLGACVTRPVDTAQTAGKGRKGDGIASLFGDEEDDDERPADQEDARQGNARDDDVRDGDALDEDDNDKEEEDDDDDDDDDDNDKEDEQKVARRKRPGGHDLYLQRLKKRAVG